jgi:hypothetical protein
VLPTPQEMGLRIKQQKKKRIGANSLTCSISRVKGRVKALGWN